MKSIEFSNNTLKYIDQTQLPHREVWKNCSNLDESYKAIQELQVRGAPLIGIFAAYSLVVHMENFDLKKFDIQFKEAAQYLKTARPTAVNLAWSIDRMLRCLEKNYGFDIYTQKNKLKDEAIQIHQEDQDLCNRIAENGLTLFQSGDRILTHCNAGFLATGGIGTAIGVIYKVHKTYKDITVYADETRPLLQGARLTAWELAKAEIPSFLITDNMAGFMMQQGLIDKVIVGADRIASNGDAANKIGTYSVAVLAKYHNIPFFVAAPYSTFDLELASGDEIPIEERNPEEVKSILNKLPIAPESINVKNPAFDVTPGELISAIITDKAVFKPPYEKEVFQNAFQNRID